MTDNQKKCAVKLANPSASPLQVLADGGLDVSVHVTTRELEWAWAKLGAIMDREPSSRRNGWVNDGHTEDELRLLCGAFCAVTRALPMGDYNYTDWLLDLGGGADSLDGFVAYRLREMNDEELGNIFSSALRGRNLDSLGLERIDEPVRVRRSGREPKKAQDHSMQTV